MRVAVRGVCCPSGAAGTRASMRATASTTSTAHVTSLSGHFLLNSLFVYPSCLPPFCFPFYSLTGANRTNGHLFLQVGQSSAMRTGESTTATSLCAARSVSAPAPATHASVRPSRLLPRPRPLQTPNPQLLLLNQTSCHPPCLCPRLLCPLHPSLCLCSHHQQVQLHQEQQQEQKPFGTMVLRHQGRRRLQGRRVRWCVRPGGARRRTWRRGACTFTARRSAGASGPCPPRASRHPSPRAGRRASTAARGAATTPTPHQSAHSGSVLLSECVGGVWVVALFSFSFHASYLSSLCVPVFVCS